MSSEVSKLPSICLSNPDLCVLYLSSLQSVKTRYKEEKSNFYTQIIHKAFTQETLNNKGVIICEEDSDGYLHDYLVRIKAKTAKLFVLELDSEKPIGEGTFSVVYQIKEIVTKTLMAFKVLNTRDNSHRPQDLFEMRRAKEAINAVNPNGGTTGIMKKPLAIIGISLPKDGTAPISLLKEVGSLELLYDSDLFTKIERLYTIDPRGQSSKAERLSICKQLVNGLAELHEKNLTHCDIKPENILLEGQGKIVNAYIADFGGVKKASELYKDPKVGPISPRFNFLFDAQDETYAINDTQWGLVHDYKMHRDVCQMGVTIAMILTLSWPFQDIDEENESFLEVVPQLYADPIRKSWGATHSEALITLLNQMLDSDLHKRISAKEALRQIELIPTPAGIV